MKVFKFGGASIKSAEAVKNLVSLLNREDDRQMIMVVSAMGKTTNALEDLLESKMQQDGKVAEKLKEIVDFHRNIAGKLFPEGHKAFDELKKEISSLEEIAMAAPRDGYDREYDRLVSRGELLSGCIIHHYLQESGISNTLMDARMLIKTDDNHRAARVDLRQTQHMVASLFAGNNEEGNDGKSRIILTQGFIGSDDRKNPTTLGREGSDYTAAIFAYTLDAENVVTWKDVPGFFNADPKAFEKARRLQHISFHETIELAYYGAKIIHPYTIKPLQNKSIPLYVRSFLEPAGKGTVVDSDASDDGQMEFYIIKDKQVLISLLSRDYEFIMENSLAFIFGKFAAYGIKINLMQNSAITFSACVERNEEQIASLILDLQDHYDIRYNENVQLLTIRHFNDRIIENLTAGREILVEQRSRSTVQFVMKQASFQKHIGK